MSKSLTILPYPSGRIKDAKGAAKCVLHLWSVLPVWSQIQLSPSLASLIYRKHVDLSFNIPKRLAVPYWNESLERNLKFISCSPPGSLLNFPQFLKDAGCTFNLCMSTVAYGIREYEMPRKRWDGIIMYHMYCISVLNVVKLWSASTKPW